MMLFTIRFGGLLMMGHQASARQSPSFLFNAEALSRVLAEELLYARQYRMIKIHTSEEARQRVRARAETPEFAISQRARRKVGGAVRRAEQLHRTTPTEATPDALRARAEITAFETERWDNSDK